MHNTLFGLHGVHSLFHLFIFCLSVNLSFRIIYLIELIGLNLSDTCMLFISSNQQGSWKGLHTVLHTRAN